MKRHGIFGGWFTLGGVRGRLSYLFSSLFSYIFFTVIIYLFFLFGFQLVLGLALSGFQSIDFSKYLFLMPFGFLFLLTLCIYTCIEVQRLRDIGVNELIILILVLLAYFIWYLGVRFSLDNLLNPEIGYHWTQFTLLIYFLFLLFIPSSKKDQIKDSKKAIRSDNINQNKDDKRIDPTL